MATAFVWEIVGVSKALEVLVFSIKSHKSQVLLVFCLPCLAAHLHTPEGKISQGVTVVQRGVSYLV